MKIALISLNQSWEDKEANKKLCLQHLEECKPFGLDLVIFPEMTLTGFSMNTEEIAEIFENSDTISWFAKQAQKFKINIVFGVVLKSNLRAKNHLIFVSKDGKLLVNYAKIHPFSFSGESKFYDGGSEIKFIEFANSILGFTICYDLRFPELFQALSNKSEIIINIANWPKKRINHWRILLKSRAIENQVYMIGVNRTGQDGNGLEYEKSSLIINPNGEEVNSIYSNKSIELFEINTSEVQNARKSFPIKDDRKIEIYRSIL